jgi:hypothetical protein
VQFNSCNDEVRDVCTEERLLVIPPIPSKASHNNKSGSCARYSATTLNPRGPARGRHNPCCYFLHEGHLVDQSGLMRILGCHECITYSGLQRNVDFHHGSRTRTAIMIIIMVMQFIIFEHHFRVFPKYVNVWEGLLFYVSYILLQPHYGTEQHIASYCNTINHNYSDAKLLQIKIVVPLTLLPDLSASMSDFLLLRMPQPIQSQWRPHQQ